MRNEHDIHHKPSRVEIDIVQQFIFAFYHCFVTDGMSRQSSAQGPRGSATRRTVNLDDTDEPYQMSSKQEVGK